MTKEERNEIVNNTFLELMEIMCSKGIEYSRGEEDVLSNFKRIAAELEGAPLDPITVAYIYAKKHEDSITNWVKTRVVHSEPIEKRLYDKINYGLLLLCLIEDAKRIKFADAKLAAAEIASQKAMEAQNHPSSRPYTNVDCPECGSKVMLINSDLSLECAECKAVYDTLRK